MNQDQLSIFLILFATLALFAWGRWRYDIVAIIALLAAVGFGLVENDAVFSGFGHPAVITVAAVLIISQGLKNAGVATLIAEHMQPFTGHPVLHLGALTLTVTVASAFMNNVGALALMLPVAMATAAEHKRSPAMLLMPLAFGSILGGLTTMIGTPPNIIIASYRAESSGVPFAMFDFSPVGIAIALIGVLFVTLIGWRFIPAARMALNAPQQLFQIAEYLTEVRITDDSLMIGKRLPEIPQLDTDDIDIVGTARHRGLVMGTPMGHQFRKGEILVLRCDPEKLPPLLAELGLEVQTSATHQKGPDESQQLLMVEGIVNADSPLIRRDVAYLRRRVGDVAALVALARQGKAMRRRLYRQRFQAGDVLLLQVAEESEAVVLDRLGLLPLAKRDLVLGKRRRLWWALGMFMLAIGLGVSGVISTSAAFVGVVVTYVWLDILPLREIYKTVDWPIIVLLGAMIPVGRALETTGATELLSGGIVSMTAGMPPIAILTLLMIATMLLSDVINNAATALVMAPIAVGIATTLGVSTDAFLMAVAVGASCAFMTPIGHQSNTLVMGPGGYQFGDYWRMGLPLDIIIVLVAVPLIVIVWPL